MKTILAAAALGFAATSALASGPVAPPPYVPPVTVPTASAYDWSGAYAGLGVTYGRMQFDTNGAIPSYPDADGWGLSGIAGYNWQSGNLVFGGEVVADFSNREGMNDCGAPGNNCTSAVENQASIRGRVGYAMDRSLMFMTVGYGRDERGAAGTLGGGSAVYSGPMLGVGYEQALGSGAWTMRGDLEHYFYGDEQINGIATNGDTSILRLSVIRRF
ncbi:outer membrane protein [Pararhodobacter sp.]|uniref:outer membrane protein n=1 Tax=Pararhodobacter sp. TaxID=2127056 RepID=UPI002FDF596F